MCRHKEIMQIQIQYKKRCYHDVYDTEELFGVKKARCMHVLFRREKKGCWNIEWEEGLGRELNWRSRMKWRIQASEGIVLVRPTKSKNCLNRTSTPRWGGFGRLNYFHGWVFNAPSLLAGTFLRPSGDLFFMDPMQLLLSTRWIRCRVSMSLTGWAKWMWQSCILAHGVRGEFFFFCACLLFSFFFFLFHPRSFSSSPVIERCPSFFPRAVNTSNKSRAC